MASRGRWLQEMTLPIACSWQDVLDVERPCLIKLHSIGAGLLPRFNRLRRFLPCLILFGGSIRHGRSRIRTERVMSAVLPVDLLRRIAQRQLSDDRRAIAANGKARHF